MRKSVPDIKNALLFFLGSVVLLLIVCIGGNSLLNSREATRKQLEAELKRLPVFDYDAERHRLCEENKIKESALAIQCPPRADIEAEIAKNIKTATDKEYPASKLVQEIAKLNVTVAILGNTVEVKYHNEAGKEEVIKGVYEDRSATEVFIGGKSIKMKNILPESLKQFKNTEGKRDKLIEAKKVEFEADRQKFAAEHRSEIEQAAYLAAGYFCTSKKEWLPPQEFISLELELRQKKIETERKEKIASLRQKYKAWGMVPFNLKITNPES